MVASAVGALFLSQLQQFVLATGASAAVQNLVQAGTLALAVSRVRPPVRHLAAAAPLAAAGPRQLRHLTQAKRRKHKHC